MTDALLQTKLGIPQLRSRLVPRPRLIEKLDAGMDGRLILVSAPAGSGKTTLVVEWLSSRDEGGRLVLSETEGMKNERIQSSSFIFRPSQVAWLSLDGGDNDPQRFMMYLLAALRKIDAGIGRSVEAMMRSPQPPPGDAIMTALVNDISAVAQPFLLILDDYHVLHSPPIFQQVNFLVEHLPQQMHLIVITREDPPLPLPRLRARGQLTEIRQTDLRFTLEECAEFLNQVMGLDLPPADIASLERRTEGWIAGLQLAALSMRGRDDLSGFIEAFTGSSHFVLDFLIEEVFNQQPDHVQNFLLKTSILEKMCAPLCDAVISYQSSVISDVGESSLITGHRSLLTNSRSILEYLEHSNLFIIPLDQSRTWYRYHRLFADLLHQRLQTSGIEPEAKLHRLASQWFQKEGFFPEAIGHSLAASDWERATNLIENQSVLMLRRGELMTLLGWFKSLPEEVIRARPQLCRDYGWSLTLTGQFDAAVPYLDCAERAAQGNDERLGQVMVAQAYLARARADNPRAIALSQQALSLIAKADILHRGLALFTLGFALFKTGCLSEAEPILLDACTTARLSGNDFIRQTTLGLLGAIQSSQGKLRSAAEFYRQSLNEANGLPTAAEAQVFLADILYEWNDLDSAASQLAGALKASQYIGSRGIQLDALCAMVRLYIAQGDISAALETLDEIHRLMPEKDYPFAKTPISILHAIVALAQEDIPLAAHWVQQMADGTDSNIFGLTYQAGMTQSKLLLAQGQHAEAAKILFGLYASVAQKGMIAIMIEVRAMQALAAEIPNVALEFLREALRMAQPEGFIRTFVDKGEPMKFLLERMKAEGGELKDYVLTLLRAFGGESARGSRAQPLVEAMSERELEILRLMADGLSNREIAERLVITVGTTKSHVHHILEKLGTESRMQAVAKARELRMV